MADTSQGVGWWIASDGKWYPPEQHPSASRQELPIAPLPPFYSHGVEDSEALHSSLIPSSGEQTLSPSVINGLTTSMSWPNF